MLRYALACVFLGLALASFQSIEAVAQFGSFSVLIAALVGVRWLGGTVMALVGMAIAIPAFDYLVADPVGEVSATNVLILLAQVGGVLGLTSVARPAIRKSLPWTRKEPASARQSALPPRERQVAALIARGLTNRQIAEELVISEGTVRSHVAHILTRLDARSRAQIAVWATKAGL